MRTGSLPWWRRPNARETKTQISIAANLLLLGVALPAGIAVVIARKENAALGAGAGAAPHEHAERADEDATVLLLLNEGRRAKNLAPLARLLSRADLDPPYLPTVSEGTAMSDELWSRVLATREKYAAADEAVHAAPGAFSARERAEAVAQLGEMAPNAAIDACHGVPTPRS
jgi:hypothetical protein